MSVRSVPARSAAALKSPFDTEVLFAGCFAGRLGTSWCGGWMRGAGGSHSSRAGKDNGAMGPHGKAPQPRTQLLSHWEYSYFFSLIFSNKVSVKIPGELRSVGSGGLCKCCPADPHSYVLFSQLRLSCMPLESRQLLQACRGHGSSSAELPMLGGAQSFALRDSTEELGLPPKDFHLLYTSFSSAWTNPLLLWLCSVTDAL